MNLIKTTGKALLLAAICTASLLAGPLPAVETLDIDFRTNSWNGANNQTSFTVAGVTATAKPNGSTLWQDGTDGLGVRGGSENDEIDGRERLIVSFATEVVINAFGITDLFKAPDGGGEPLGEHGVAKFYKGATLVATVNFYGNDSHQANGEQWITGLSYQVDKVKFYLGNDKKNNEFSVGGFNISGVPDTGEIPEPGTISMMAIGLGAVALAYRRRKATTN